MDTYARKLFLIAAGFNFAVAAALWFLRDQMAAILDLDPITGTNVAFIYFAAALIASYGYAYARIAYDPHKYRVYIPLGVIGKLMAVGAVCWPWHLGAVSWRLPMLASGDLVFAVLFVDYLRRTRSA